MAGHSLLARFALSSLLGLIALGAGIWVGATHVIRARTITAAEQEAELLADVGASRFLRNADLDRPLSPARLKALEKSLTEHLDPTANDPSVQPGRPPALHIDRRLAPRRRAPSLDDRLSLGPRW